MDVLVVPRLKRIGLSDSDIILLRHTLTSCIDSFESRTLLGISSEMRQWKGFKRNREGRIYPAFKAVCYNCLATGKSGVYKNTKNPLNICIAVDKGFEYLLGTITCTTC